MKAHRKLLICIGSILSTIFSINAQANFQLPQLNYSYDALEGVIDARTMQIHHSKHHQAYVNNLNKALSTESSATLTIEDIVKNISNYPLVVRNNAGGHYNHSLFWTILTPTKNTQPADNLLQAIIQQFSSIDSLITKMNKDGVSLFGSGWVWLSVDKHNKLFISTTANQDNPLMNIPQKQGYPILGIDLWEHAYYLNYQNKRAEYLNAIWRIINWEVVSERYNKALAQNSDNNMEKHEKARKAKKMKK